MCKCLRACSIQRSTAGIRLAKEMDAATKRGEDLGLTDDEIAFYDALAANESAVKAMGDDKLKVIAAELITQVRKSVTIDWTLCEGVFGSRAYRALVRDYGLTQEYNAT